MNPKIEILSRREFSKQFKLMLEKTENQTYDSGCIMGYFDSAVASDPIKPEDIFDNDENEYGLEIEPHVTVLYGLTDAEIDEDEVIRLLAMTKCPTVNFVGVSTFKNDKYDVVKWDVESDELNLLNKIVTSIFPYKSNFPDYHAHCTIAYCKVGTGDAYATKPEEPIKKEIAYWVYSKADGKKIRINQDGTTEIMREANDDEANESIMMGKRAHDLDGLPPVTLKDDESFVYKGYDIKLERNAGFGGDAYNCSVYLNGKYEMGLRGPVSLDKAKEAAKLFVDGQCKKKNGAD